MTRPAHLRLVTPAARAASSLRLDAAYLLAYVSTALWTPGLDVPLQRLDAAAARALLDFLNLPGLTIRDGAVRYDAP